MTMPDLFEQLDSPAENGDDWIPPPALGTGRDSLPHAGRRRRRHRYRP